MLSINALLQVIQTVAEAHSQINKFAAGQRYDFSASEALQYPCLWVVPNGGSLDVAGKRMDYRFTFIMMDLDNHDGTNQIEVLSDTALILADIIAVLQNEAEAQQQWQLTTGSGFEPFADAQLDTVSGYIADVTISVMYDGDVCNDIFAGINLPDINALTTDAGEYLLWT